MLIADCVREGICSVCLATGGWQWGGEGVCLFFSLLFALQLKIR